MRNQGNVEFAFMLQFYTMRNSLVFMGSPFFAEVILRSLAEEYDVKGVVTQPDKPAGRGKVIKPPPVKSAAGELQIPVIQPHRLKEPGVFEQLIAWAPDAIIVAAFGQILRRNVLELPPYGCINVHASLLPRWRGASPVQASIQAGDRETGITIMKMDEGIDTGEILAQEKLTINLDDTTRSLTEHLAKLGADLLKKTLPDYLLGKITPISQDHTKATYAPMVKKEEAILDLNKNGFELVNLIRSFLPWPIARVQIHGQELLIHKASWLEDPQAIPGQEYRVNRFPALGTGNGYLVLQELQIPGKKVISGKDYLNGNNHWGLHNT